MYSDINYNSYLCLTTIHNTIVGYGVDASFYLDFLNKATQKLYRKILPGLYNIIYFK